MKSQSLTPYLQCNRLVYCTGWRDPRNNKRRNKSLRTRELTEAKQICVDLERILNNPEYQIFENPDISSFHPTSVELFFGVPPPETDPYIKISPGNKIVKGHGSKPGGGLFYSTKHKDALVRIIELERERARLLHDNEILKQQNFDLLRLTGRHDITPLSEAIQLWLERDYSTRTKHTQQEAANALNSLSKCLGERTAVSKVTPSHIDDWLAQ